MVYDTTQENFWAGEFGDDYLSRNDGEQLIVRRMIHFSRFFKSTSNINSIIFHG